MIASVESISAANGVAGVSAINGRFDEGVRHTEAPPAAIFTPINLQNPARAIGLNLHGVLAAADHSIGKVEGRLKATLHLLQTQRPDIESLSIVQLEMSRYVVTVGVISGVAEGCKKAISSLTQQQ